VTPPGRGAVFLLTDYGVEDEFAGLTRAVLLREAPSATVVDLTHGVPPFDVRAGALILSRSVGYLGHGVVVAVVDPGVGSGRRAVAVSVRSRTGPRFLLGPDNGLLPWAVEVLGGPEEAVALTAPDPGPAPSSTGRETGRTGRTFDGRDLFAPLAARLWSGSDLSEIGTPIDPGTLVVLAPPLLRVSPAGPGRPGMMEAEVVWVDRFGNAQLAAGPDDAEAASLEGPLEIRTPRTIRRARPVVAFADLDPRRAGSPDREADPGDEVGVMVDANGNLSLVCFERPAATVLGVGPGDMVTLRRLPTGS
jgi:S-adenosylmethionine hydrolase